MPGSSFPEELAFLRCVVSLTPLPSLSLSPTELISGAPNVTSQFKDSDVILSQFLPSFGFICVLLTEKKGQTKMQMFFSICYLLVLTLLREGFDLFSCVLGRLETSHYIKIARWGVSYRPRHNRIWNPSLKAWPKKICHSIRNSKTNLTPFTRLSHPPSLFSSVRNPPVNTSSAVHTVSFDWFLSVLEWILNLEFYW